MDSVIDFDSFSSRFTTGSTKDHKSVHISLWQNLRKALDSLKMVPLPPTKTDDEEEGEDEPSAKRQKTGRNNSRMKPKKKRPPPIRYARHDPFNLWLHVPLPKNEDGDEDSGSVLGEDEDVIPPTIGGRLSQLGVAGFVNAFALVTGGHVRNKNVTEPKDEAARSQVLLQLNTKVAPISLTALHSPAGRHLASRDSSEGSTRYSRHYALAHPRHVGVRFVCARICQYSEAHIRHGYSQ